METKAGQNEERTRDQYTVVLEQINSKIDLLVEGHQGLNERLERFEADTNSNFKSVFEYLSRIEDEMMEVKEGIKDLKKTLTQKADLERLLALEKRVQKVEESLRQARLAGAKA